MECHAEYVLLCRGLRVHGGHEERSDDYGKNTWTDSHRTPADPYAITPGGSCRRLWCKLKPTVKSVRASASLSRVVAHGAQAASAAFHSSVIVALYPPSLPVLNCPFLIFSASSIPEIVITALSNRLKPSMGRIRCFILRWSCSTRLFKYWLDRTLTRPGSSPSAFISRTARCEAA